jgi:membrane protein DedA with SNARE-associated domain
MGYVWFSVATVAGAIPWNFVLAYAGLQLGQHWEVVATTMQPFVIPIGIGVVILLGVAWWFGRKLGEAEDAIMEKALEKN